MSAGLHNVLSAVDPSPLIAENNHNDVNGVNGHAVSDQQGYKLGNFAIDEVRPIKVVVIGAGFAGIIAGIRFAQKIKNIEMTIYEKLAGVGGTWYANRYPGLACDIPSHTYQLTFEQKTDWSAFYAPGAEIQVYLQGVVDKYKLSQYLKLQHELVQARYDETEAKWYLTLRRPVSQFLEEGSEPQFEEFEDTADVLFGALGPLSRWSMPDILGLKEFKGKLIHSAAWEGEPGTWQETVKDWGDKTIGVIGVGSSALQIVPALQPRVKKLYNYVRGKTWLSTSFASDTFNKLLNRDPDSTYAFYEEEKKTFSDPEYYKVFRHEIEASINSNHPSTISGHPMAVGAAEAFKAIMQKRLEKKPWIIDHLLPNFSVGCRRLTPGPGYLEALCEDNVDFIHSRIKRITETGIETEDGQHIDMDVIICATGYNTDFQLHFPILGRGGKSLDEHYAPHPRTYLSTCTSGFPNFFFATGPNSGVGSGSLLVVIERHVEYAVKAVQKMQRERLKSIEVKEEAVRDYDEYIDNYFPTTVFGEKCRSWYKMGKDEGRIVGLYPGSCLHAVRALEHPRWEDFNYEYIDRGNKNRLYWLGDGFTYNEKYMVGDRAWYLNDEEIDIPPIPSSKSDIVTANGVNDDISSAKS